MRQADCASEGVVGVHLNGERLVGEEQFEQQFGFGSSRIAALEPNLTDRCPIPAQITPRAQVRFTPRLLNYSSRGNFQSHRRYLDSERVVE